MSENKILKVSDNFFSVDIIRTSAGNIRIGSGPKISKLLKKNNLKDNYVILPPFIVNYAGDNYTGEEFVHWSKIYQNDYTPITYIGIKKNIKYLYKRLSKTINYTFNKEKTKIIKKARLKKIFKKIVAKYDKTIKLSNDVEVIIKPYDILIYEKNKKIYSWTENINYNVINQNIGLIMKKYEPNKYINYLEIIALGNGNGFRGNTSNFIIRYGDRVIWVDVMAEPFLALKKLNLNFRNVTDYFISHIHEDHIEGLSAILKYASDKSYKINLITTRKIFREIKEIFEPLITDFKLIVNHINIIPNVTLPYYHGYLTVRLNHHVLKSGTLGLKVQFKNNVFALSGDTKYDSKLALKLKNNPAFDISWYNDSHLIFHEVEFEDPNNVHTFYTEVQKIIENVNGKLLVYHNSSPKFLLPKVEEYTRYIIKDGNLKIKRI